MKGHRLLHIIPGAITWIVLTSPIWLARPLPLLVAFFITFLTVFWVYRAFIYIVGLYIGYRRYKREVALNWNERLQKLNKSDLENLQDLPENLEGIRHLIVVPLVNEEKVVLYGLIEALAHQTFPISRIFLAFSIEEKFHEKVENTLKQVLNDFPQLQNVFLFVHPLGLPDEVPGAASNRTWGAKNALEEIKRKNLDPNHFIITTMDGDAVLDKQYLARLTYEFIVQPKRRNLFFQPAVFLFNNNIWQVPILMRIQATSVTLATLAGWVTEPFFKETFSCFSLAFSTLINVNFWDTTITIDDTPLFWRIFNYYHGDFRGVPLFTPVSSDAVEGKSFVDSHIKQYRQLLRWGWGIIVFPMAIEGLFKARAISLGERFLWFYRFLERYAIWYTIVILITFGFPVLAIINPEFKATTFSFLLPQITSYFLTGALILLLPGAWFRNKFMIAPPQSWPKWRRMLAYCEGGLVIVHLFTYVFLPHFHAETLFMLGKSIQKFEFMIKVRNKNATS